MTARFGRVWRDRGARGVAHRMLEEVYADWLVFGRELVPEMPQPSPDPRLRFADLTGGDAELAAGMHLAVETARARLAAGHMCFAMLLDDRPVAMVWARPDVMWLPFLRRRIPLDEGQLYFYDSFTDRGHRRLGLTSQRRAHSHAAAYERGFRSARSYVLTHNTAGVAAARAAGYEVLERHRQLLLGPLGRGRDREIE